MDSVDIERCLRHVEALSAEDIGEVIEDVELRRKKTRIYYAVDPFEIVDYCFPIEPNLARRAPQVSTEQLANDQAALYELFNCGESPVFVLPAYRSELAGIEAYVRFMIQRAYNASRQLFDLLSSDLGEAPDAEAEERLDALEENFSLILALNLGVLSLGTKRFSDLLSGPVSPQAPRHLAGFEGDKDRLSWPVLQPTVVTSIALACLRQSDADSEAATGGTRSPADRQALSSMRDASAIDYIMTLNRELLRQYDDTRLRDRVLVLYVSSAKRSHRILRDRQIVQRFPVIEGKQYSIWRTREQIYALAAAGGLGPLSSAKLQAAKRRLLDVKKLLSGLSAMPHPAQIPSSQRCMTCALSGGTDRSCPSYPRCSGLRRLATSLERRSSHVANLSFVETADRYQSLTSKIASRPLEDVARAESRTSRLAQWRTVLQWSANSADAKGLAIERRHLLQHLVLVKASFAPWYGVLNGAADTLPTARRREFVTSGDQALPIWIEVAADEQEILADIQAAAFDNSWRRASFARTALSDAARKFLEAEVGAGRFDPSHELVRCLLFMVSGDLQGSNLAAEHAAAMRKLLWRDNPEFLYVQIWSEFRSGRARHAMQLASEASEAWPEDWRFPLGRALARYQAWKESGMKSSIGWKSVKMDLWSAMELLESRSQVRSTLRGRVRAAILNDLAYFQAVEGSVRRRAADRDNLAAAARRDLDELKKHKSGRSEDWALKYPEFLHTEATVELLEASVLTLGGKQSEALRKLQFALTAIDNALRVLDKPTFLETKNEIEREIARLVGLESAADREEQ